jgi:hypothetical protein
MSIETILIFIIISLAILIPFIILARDGGLFLFSNKEKLYYCFKEYKKLEDFKRFECSEFFRGKHLAEYNYNIYIKEKDILEREIDRLKKLISMEESNEN